MNNMSRTSFSWSYLREFHQTRGAWVGLASALCLRAPRSPLSEAPWEPSLENLRADAINTLNFLSSGKASFRLSGSHNSQKVYYIICNPRLPIKAHNGF